METFHTKNLRIGITLGDFNGVGPEVILKTFADNRMSEFFTPIVYGSSKVLNFYRKILGLNDLQLVNIKKAEEANIKRLNVINCWEEDVEVKPGIASEISGSYALKSLDAAIKDWNDGKIDAIVTAPLNKSTIKIPDGIFTGHTDYIAQKTGSQKPLMMLISDSLRVGLATVHIPLKEISQKLSKELIVQKINTIANSLINDYSITKPRIAVLGLNPHAGEDGLLGNEEQNIIVPAIEQVRKEGTLVYGCYPADGFFGSHQYKQFDAILAMYHDQGLVPFKYMHFHDGVNYTAGLTIVRTSPDHGTAYQIAGKGTVNEESFRNAVFMAAELVSNRQVNAKLRENPLKFTPLRRERFKLDL
ncbi:MAG: 4-hydroxythreonine-4-phosphate dehydrogenase PdxA [Bacteroidetes bacterium]|nr:4-hydroxythreonine-4-phosphate dehydrogenase PdxA [Bacteroidota bacterium]